MAIKRMFDDNMYRFDTPQQSYWEATGGDEIANTPSLQSDKSCDVAIIGGGYTGLSAALHLARDYDIDVRVLEAGPIGWGASGRNGGFCCIGGTGVARHDLPRYVGVEPAREFTRTAVEAVDFVRELTEQEGIDCQPQGDAEIEVAHSARAAAELEKYHDVMNNVLGVETRLYTAGECRERFYDCTENFGAIEVRPTFGLHPLRYCRGLAGAAERHGAKLHSRSRVLNWEKGADGKHRLHTAGGSVRAKRVVYASNGFIQENLEPRFYGRTLPVISAIVGTRPLSDDELAAQNWRTDLPAANTRSLLNYFRVLPDRTLVFGGRGHTTGHPNGEAETYEQIIASLYRIWPAWSEVEIRYRWHGLICFTASLAPSIGRLDDDPSVFFGFGYHGNGVAYGSWTGSKIAEWLATNQKPAALPAICTGLSRKFPIPKLRGALFRLGVSIAKWRDART